VEEPVADGVGEGRVADVIVPLHRRHLAGVRKKSRSIVTVFISRRSRVSSTRSSLVSGFAMDPISNTSEVSTNSTQAQTRTRPL
jgi:hypothetical protein